MTISKWLRLTNCSTENFTKKKFQVGIVDWFLKNEVWECEVWEGKQREEIKEINKWHKFQANQGGEEESS